MRTFITVATCAFAIASGMPALASETAIAVPTDPGAAYTLLSYRKLNNGHVEAVTRRVGPSGQSFARREISCRNMTFRYTGEGDTLEELNAPYDRGRMGRLIEGSISTYISKAVCRRIK